MKIYRIRSYELNHKLREPSRISYQSTNSAKNVLVLIETNENICGVGESAPFKPSTGDTQKIALKFLKLANDKLKGENPCNIENIQFLLRDISKKIDFNSQTAKTAIDSACYDILGKVKNKPVYKLLSSKKPITIPNTITVYIRSIEETVKKIRYIMNKYRKSGICRVKLKLSGNPKLDKKRVLESAKIFPGEFTLDANEAYKNADLAIEVFNDIFEVLGSRVILIEQPSPRDDLKKLEYITERCKIPIFSDETVNFLGKANG
jgi:L-alanine-DL-glutamate epimerase-like enolase superfamily enzyme